LYNFCKKHNMTIRMPEGVPDFVSKSFELIPVTLLVGGTFILGRFVLMQTAGELPPPLLTRFLSPLVGSMDNPWSVLA
ncbi:PTS sugar transporter subunit IIC, partial [Enterococcus sp. S181_ASV_20]|nr:PTS sugar transporter subunit IIC [Enterococcus sp. S181_ASV_20]